MRVSIREVRALSAEMKMKLKTCLFRRMVVGCFYLKLEKDVTQS